MSKVSIILVILLIGWGITGYKFHATYVEKSELELRVSELEQDVRTLTSEKASYQAQQSFKEKELAQTNNLLDTCYKTLAGQIGDFEEINRILQLPQKERTHECNLDQDAACLDFLNRQLLDVN